MDELYRQAASDENRQFVLDIMRKLSPDPVWMTPIIEAVESKRIETRCFVSCLAHRLQPTNYLEVGVRRGFSMAMVAARSPVAEIYGFDVWIPDYAGAPNPGPDFVRFEMRKIGYKKKIHLVNGDSHQTLPVFFRRKKSRIRNFFNFGQQPNDAPTEFQLMMIDGDHSLLGAYQDLLDTMPHCALGGAIVFDDILPSALKYEPEEIDPHGWKNLLGVWRAVQQRFPNFRYLEFLDHPPGVGVAIRLE